MIQNIPKRNIGQTNVQISELGLGCAPLGGNLVDLNREEAAALIHAAMENGIEYFDTAPWYGFGRSERVVGDCIRGFNYILSDKVGRLLAPGAVSDPSNYGMVDPLPFNVKYDYSYDGIIRAYEDNLQRLGLDRIDVLLVHDIGVFQHGEQNESYFRDLAQSGYRALIELKDAGLVSAIGLGVNENQICLDVMNIGHWDLFLLAGRYTLLEQTALAELFPKCAQQGTSIICGGPFNSGVLVGRETWNYSKAPKKVIEKAAILDEIAQAYSIPLGAAAIQFPLASNIISSVIPGPRTKSELLQILDWYQTKIPNEFWSSLRDSGLIDDQAPVPNLI